MPERSNKHREYSTNRRARAVVSAAVVLIPLLLATPACRQLETIMERETPIALGNRTITVSERWSGRNGLSFIHLHEDEETSARAALNVLQRTGGRLVMLRHTGERLITFTMNTDTFRFDPNRMFTDAGAARTLERNGSFNTAAHREVRAFADAVLHRYRIHDADAVVAVHNNRPSGYSALSYAEGGDLQAEAAAVHLKDGRDADNFFFVTERDFFEYFRRRGFNVVLQDNAGVTDDGSLSVYCGMHGIPYINVEARHGARREQTGMILAVVDLLRTSRPS